MRDTKLADDNNMNKRDGGPRISLQEIMEIAAQGIYPIEAKLEYLLDHIEGTP